VNGTSMADLFMTLLSYERESGVHRRQHR
jgi:hypothetical protein